MKYLLLLTLAFFLLGTSEVKTDILVQGGEVLTEELTINTTWDLGGATSSAVNLELKKSGKVVCINFPSVGLSGNTGTDPSFTATEVIPVGWRPLLSGNFPVAVNDNSVTQTTFGMLLISSSAGGMLLYRDTSTTLDYTTSGTAGIARATHICYAIL